LYFKWIEGYAKKNLSRITYRETGSSEGIRLLLAKDADFGATDAFLSDSEMPQAPEVLLHIPTCIGAVAIIYHLEGNPEIRLSPSVLTDIFMGRITLWSDRRIREMNPDAHIKPLNITVVHRSEGSGTTFLLSDYLSQVSTAWKKMSVRAK
jgi:phosphate transport system substrate-binding protein